MALFDILFVDRITLKTTLTHAAEQEVSILGLAGDGRFVR